MFDIKHSVDGLSGGTDTLKSEQGVVRLDGEILSECCKKRKMDV